MEESHKMVFIPSNSVASEKMMVEFAELLGFVDFKKLRRKLRLITLNFIATESENLTDDLPEFLQELNIFFDFLDVIEDELEKQK
ncbi:MAG: hypothetical protein WBH03_03370 [Cyclobacteriaceae bacterium]